MARLIEIIRKYERPDRSASIALRLSASQRIAIEAGVRLGPYRALVTVLDRECGDPGQSAQHRYSGHHSKQEGHDYSIEISRPTQVVATDGSIRESCLTATARRKCGSHGALILSIAKVRVAARCASTAREPGGLTRGAGRPPALRNQ